MMQGDHKLRQVLIGHPSLRVLMPHLKNYARKGLAELLSEGKAFPASASEIYAAGIAERVSELDNALAALRLTWELVMDLSTQSSPNPDVYRYHYENFVLRVIGFVDRAHRLVGSALFLDKARFEGIRGNSFVQAQVKTNYPDIHDALQNVSRAVDSYRGPRNELIHSTAFTSGELGLFQSIRQFGMDTEGIDVDELARQHFSGSGMEIAQTIVRLVEALTNLLTVLHPLFLIADRHEEPAGSAS